MEKYISGLAKPLVLEPKQSVRLPPPWYVIEPFKGSPLGCEFTAAIWSVWTQSLPQ